MLVFILILFAFIASLEADNSACGISPSLERYAIYNPNKMFGGENAKVGDWPWYGLLSSDEGSCGSTIISEQWVLTAGHCVGDSPVTIRYGSVKRNVGKIVYSESIFVHPDYDEIKVKNDIALIKLSQTLTFSEKVQPICLDRSVEPYPNEILTQAGFGKDFVQFRPNITLSDTNILQDSPIEYLGNSPPTCNESICVGGVNHAALPGDSGGPLMAIRNNRWIQVGIASTVEAYEYKNESISMDAKNLYTKIATYCDWIAETTKNGVIC